MKKMNIKLVSIIFASILLAGSILCILGGLNARSVALNHAGLTKDKVGFIEWDFDIDDFWATYEVEWYYNGIEYEYTINAFTANIVKYEWD